MPSVIPDVDLDSMLDVGRSLQWRIVLRIHFCVDGGDASLVT